MYESEITKFLRELKQKHPNIPEDQRRGRAIWWDKDQDTLERENNQQSNVKQQAYVYQTRR